jgi:uncharacterized protein (DUF2225 family)
MVRHQQKPEKDEKEKKVTFIAKESVRCPVCDASFHREELFSGRLNAGNLTDELRRTYIPMQAYGEIHPLVYDVTVCPSCWYAAYKADFSTPSPKVASALSADTAARVDAVQRLFGPTDFNSPRGLVEGAASYYLAMLSYEKCTKEAAPVFKQGLSSLRAAWLCSALAEKRPGENFDYVAQLFYKKARFLYRLAVECETKGSERFSLQKWLGPDNDKNYGYEGVLYLEGVLELKYGPRNDEARRAAALESSKRNIAKMFGLGKSSKSKPGPLLDKARDLYDVLKAELKQEDEETDD